MTLAVALAIAVLFPLLNARCLAALAPAKAWTAAVSCVCVTLLVTIGLLAGVVTLLGIIGALTLATLFGVPVVLLVTGGLNTFGTGVLLRNTGPIILGGVVFLGTIVANKLGVLVCGAFA